MTPADPPRLAGLATAVPAHVLEQDEVRAHVADLFRDRAGNDLARLLSVFANAGVARRYASLPLSACGTGAGWPARSAHFERAALNLLTTTAERTLTDAQMDAQSIDALVVVSSTGIVTPSLDAHLLERLPFRRDLMRLPIFGLGCAGGALSLGRAGALAAGQAPARVLLLVVELCAHTFRRDDLSSANIVATALFGDGAAGAVISTHPDDAGPALIGWGEYTWPDSLDVMGWSVERDGLGVIFARNIPALVRSEMRAICEQFLHARGLSVDELAATACHPGGARVLEALEDAFAVPRGAMAAARGVLRDYGNMSAPTVLFVLIEVLAEARRPGPILASSLGPGFSAGFALIRPDGDPA